MVEEKKTKKWFGKTLLIICSCLFLLMIIVGVTTDWEEELQAELDETETVLASTKKELSLANKELEDALTTISELEKLQSDLQNELTDTKGVVAELRIKLAETETELIKTQSDLRAANTSTQGSSADDLFSGITKVPDYTYQLGLQIGGIISANTLLDSKRQVANICKETTIPILTSLAQEYLKTVPQNEEKKLFYFAGYSLPMLNGQMVLDQNNIDCDISTPLNDLLQSM